MPWICPEWQSACTLTLLAVVVVAVVVVLSAPPGLTETNAGSFISYADKYEQTGTVGPPLPSIEVQTSHLLPCPGPCPCPCLNMLEARGRTQGAAHAIVQCQ